jgi:hypothetical protein
MKPYTLETIPDSRIALFRWVGPITLEDRLSNLRMIEEYASKHDLHSVIADAREESSQLSQLQMFEFASKIPELSPSVRWAVVLQSGDEESIFAGGIAAAEGALIQLFETIEEARSWLDTIAERSAEPSAEG